jgi:heme A synthase
MFISLIVTTLVGLLCIVLGICNMRGNISSIHSYHRHRVKEEDRLPFGRLMGIGTVIVGIFIIILGIFMFLSELLVLPVLIPCGIALFTAGFLAGMGLCLYAMIKYNKGIF